MFFSILSYKTFFAYFIYNQDSNHLSKQEKKKVQLLRIFCSIVTCGLLPKLCQWKWSSSNKIIAKQKEREFLTKVYQKAIQQTIDPYLDDRLPNETKADLLVKSKDADAEQIINGLFLGSGKAFAKTTGLKLGESNPLTGRVSPVDTTNPQNFRIILTICPLIALYGMYEGLDLFKKGELEKALKASYQKHDIKWHYIGRSLTDDANSWATLAHDASCPSSPKALIEIEGLEEKTMNRLEKKKEQKIQKLPASALFEKTFKKIDKAVFGGEKMLVHCQAGRSRSAALLAAYLINRFEVSSEEAIAFLRKRRFCVDPKFAASLQNYSTALRRERMQASSRASI